MGLSGRTDIEVQRKRIGTLIESPGMYPNMTASENMEKVLAFAPIKKYNN